jgi:hypothetical protein
MKIERQISPPVVHVQDELRSVDSVRETGIVLNERCSRELSARMATFQHQRAQVRSGCVNGSRQPRAAASNNDQSFHRLKLST